MADQGAGVVEQREILDAIRRAQGGDEDALTHLIETFKPFAAHMASRVAGHSLSWENDDELSIALAALGEAIQSYRPDRGARFTTFAGTVIQRRVVDYYRREQRWSDRRLLDSQSEDLAATVEHDEAMRLHQERETSENRAQDLQEFAKLLVPFGISLWDLARKGPKHTQTRLDLLCAARILASRPEWMDHLLERRTLPLQELVDATRLSRKTLKSGRAFIVAVALVLAHPHLTHIRSFFHLERGDGPCR